MLISKKQTCLQDKIPPEIVENKNKKMGLRIRIRKL
jgi:hypothetical protein